MDSANKKKIIIVGASSGIGRGLAELYASKGHTVGITGRRINMLQDIKDLYPDNIRTMPFDVCETDSNIQNIDKLIALLGGLDLFIYSSGTGYINEKLDWNKEDKTIQTNVVAFTQITGYAYNFLAKQNQGHIVCISSIASVRGSQNAPAYNASKAFQANYIEGLQLKSKSKGHNIHVTDIQPGFVDTAMAIGSGQFWVSSVQKASQQIYRAIAKKKRKAYITYRWRLIAWLLKIMSPALFIKVRK